jgi:Cu(I)/Ag(I) efflux system membrane protein CusA/SilA
VVKALLDFGEARFDQWRANITLDGLVAEMSKALQFPGVSNAWTMPIKARIDMLSTGIRTPVPIGARA